MKDLKDKLYVSYFLQIALNAWLQWQFFIYYRIDIIVEDLELRQLCLLNKVDIVVLKIKAILFKVDTIVFRIKAFYNGFCHENFRIKGDTFSQQSRY